MPQSYPADQLWEAGAIGTADRRRILAFAASTVFAVAYVYTNEPGFNVLAALVFLCAERLPKGGQGPENFPAM